MEQQQQESNISILSVTAIFVPGSTGSIGVNTLDVIARHQDKFSIFALTGATQVDLMLQQF